jgi:Transposase IS4
MLAEIVDLTLCFLWQDNNAVLGITTAYSIKNITIWRPRKRPSPTSTNARIIRPVFGDETSKWLAIPLVIDRYNYHMNGVDRYNQLRKNMTIHRKYERRTWRPQWYFAFDTCCVNSYLIWKGNEVDLGNREHRRFQEEHSQILLNWSYEKKQIIQNRRHTRPPLPLPNRATNEHVWKLFSRRGYCQWCKKHAEKWVPQRPRRILGEIVNEEAPRKRARQSQTQGGCDSCRVYLCRKGACFEDFHSSSNNE